MKTPTLPLTNNDLAEIFLNTNLVKFPTADITKSFNADEYFDYLVTAANSYPDYIELLKFINWLEIYRPRINWNVPEVGMVEIMGMTREKYCYLFSGRSLRECVLKAMENIKC